MLFCSLIEKEQYRQPIAVRPLYRKAHSRNRETRVLATYFGALSCGTQCAGITVILRLCKIKHVRHRMAYVISGSGPGIQTPDGCSVELYRQMPYMGELSDIEADLIKHHAALELGCGTGRLCGRLLELGLRVAGVDESTAMLALLPPGVEAIEGSIETLDLGRRWPAVLLPSHLINHPEESVRRHFVESARRHVEKKGVFYVKRHSTAWLSTVQEGSIGESNGVSYFVDSVLREGDLITMTIRYEAFGQSWTQSFTTRALDVREVENLLSSCGFGGFKWLGKSKLWVAATQSDA